MLTPPHASQDLYHIQICQSPTAMLDYWLRYCILISQNPAIRPQESSAHFRLRHAVECSLGLDSILSHSYLANHLKTLQRDDSLLSKKHLQSFLPLLNQRLVSAAKRSTACAGDLSLGNESRSAISPADAGIRQSRPDQSAPSVRPCVGGLD